MIRQVSLESDCGQVYANLPPKLRPTSTSYPVSLGTEKKSGEPAGPGQREGRGVHAGAQRRCQRDLQPKHWRSSRRWHGQLWTARVGLLRAA